MRYQWFQDIPRNVTRREYEAYRLRQFGTIAFGGMAAMMLFASLSGLTLKTSRDLAKIDKMSIEDAIAHQGKRIDAVQLGGFLVADNPPTMPDDPAQKVIRGRVKLVARADTNSGNTDTEQPRRETLLDWEETADPVFLSDGERRIPLAFDLAVLPMDDDSWDFSTDTIREGDSARTRRPVAIEYGEQIYNLPLETWGEVDTVFTDLERETLPYGQSVVVVAGLETTSDGNQLIDPLGNRLQVLMGTEEEILQEGQQTRVMFFLLPIPLGVGSFLLGKSAHRLRQEFVERSNQ